MSYRKGYRHAETLKKLQGGYVINSANLKELMVYLGDIGDFFSHLNHHWISTYSYKESDCIKRILEARKQK